MMNLKLPEWLNVPFFSKLKAALQLWWALVEKWLEWPLNQLDPMTCHEGLLDVFAYKKKIRRMKNESVDLFRLRIASAYINATEAGTINGLKNILNRLNIPFVDVRQQIPGRHWAVIEVEVTQQAASDYGEFLQEVLSQYGKLCRTYEIKVVISEPLMVRAETFSYSSTVFLNK